MPAPRLLWLIVAWFALGVAAAILPALLWAWGAAAALIAALATADAVALVRSGTIRAERRAAGSLAVGAWSTVRVRLSHAGPRPLAIEVFDHYPMPSELEGLPQRLRLASGGWGEIGYRLRPLARGSHGFGQVELRVATPLGLWRRRQRVGAPQAVKVYPNFAEVAKYTLFATDHRLSRIGIRPRRRRGEGLEFHQLREFRAGDALRQIDWKATSRLKRLISREYQDERDQQVVFLIDCGRGMAAQDDALSHFDHSLNAVLLLSYVALRQGDAVGVLAFAGQDRYLPPQKGAAAVHRILNAIYDLEPTLHVPDYEAAATRLLTRLRKRSLIVLITNLRDEEAEELRPALHLLRRQHLLVLASLQEQALHQVSTRSVARFDDALLVAARALYLEARWQAHQTLRHAGVMMLDVAPQNLALALVNRYLDVKRSGRL